MPGLVGILTRAPAAHARVARDKMLDSMRHERFYITGCWEDEAIGLYVGWVVREGSFAANLPLKDQENDRTLIFSGEEYPSAALRSELMRRGHHIVPGCASYLGHIPLEEQTYPRALNGRFHGILVNHNRAAATLFNDRFGMHRVYYCQTADAFYFSAEVKGILAVCPELRRLDPRGVGEFITNGCALDNRTLFPDINLLPPASAWTLTQGRVIRRERYFAPDEWEHQEPLDAENFYLTLRETFASRLPHYFYGPERIGMSMTGGLDTRMVLAWRRPQPGTLPCYTFGSMFRECQDVVIGRRVAEACGQSYEVIEVGEEFLSRFDHYAQRTIYLSEGTVEVTRSPDLYVNERARRIAPVRMTGVYGGEVLRRVQAFRPTPIDESAFAEEYKQFIGEAWLTYRSALAGHPLSRSVFREAPWYLYGSLGLEQTQLTMRTPFLDNEIVRTVFRAPYASCHSTAVSERLIADGNPALSLIRTDLGLSIGAPRRRVLSAVLKASFKAEYAYDYGMPDWLARMDHLLSIIQFERAFLGRHKFYHFRTWYKTQLREYLRDVLLDERSLARPHINPTRVRTTLEAHFRGQRNQTREIHKLLTLELLYRTLLDRSASESKLSAA